MKCRLAAVILLAIAPGILATDPPPTPGATAVRKLYLLARSDADFARVGRMVELQELRVHILSDARDAVTDEAFAHLGRLRKLRTLDARCCPRFNDAFVREVSRLEKLEHLNLTASKVTDDGLAPLRELKQLKVLHLYATRVGDAGMAHIAAIQSLEELDLRSTGVTDAGLLALKGHSKLRRLDLRWTRVTPSGVDELRKSLPGLVVLGR